MDTEIWVAVISAVATIIGVIVTCVITSNRTQQGIELSQAVMQEKIDNLTKEVEKHNKFAERIPVLDNRVGNLEKEVEEIKTTTGQRPKKKVANE